METITMWGLLWDWSICGKLCGKLFGIGGCDGKRLGDLGVEKLEWKNVWGGVENGVKNVGF